MIKSLTKTPLRDILSLHCKKMPIELDLTWGKGNLWKGLPIPAMRNALSDNHGSNMSFDFREEWPVKNDSISGIIYDPPFLIKRGRTNSFMIEKFSCFSSVEEATKAHQEVIRRAFDALKLYGKFVVKIQDHTCDHGRVYFASQKIFSLALEVGFVAVDHFVQIGKPLIDPRVKKQLTARKSHVDWFVFEKSKKKNF